MPATRLNDATVIEILRQLVAEIPWGQNLLILNRLRDPAARLYYLQATARFGWSRNVLLNQIKAGAYERAVAEKKTHNFDLVLPEHLAEQTDEMLNEYALRTKANPIGVAAYQLHPKLPGELKGKLPTARQLAGVLRAELEEGR